MAEEILRKKIRKKTEEIDRWTEDTEQLVGEISRFIDELKTAEAGEKMTHGQFAEAEETIRSVSLHLSEVKEAMKQVRKKTVGENTISS